MMKRSFVKSRLSLAAIAAALFLSSCGDKPLFDELATNRLRVVIKGTFESNSPRRLEYASEFSDPNDLLWKMLFGQ